MRKLGCILFLLMLPLPASGRSGVDAFNEEVQQAMLANIPLKRFGDPEDVANVIHFLAGDEAAYVTGQVLTICGGMVT